MSETPNEPEYPSFEDVLMEYVRDAGLNQTTFAEAMNKSGYVHRSANEKRLSQQTVSNIARQETNVGKEFFQHTARVLGLGRKERTRLLLSYAPPEEEIDSPG